MNIVTFTKFLVFLCLLTGCSLPAVPAPELEQLPPGSGYVTLNDGHKVFERSWSAQEDENAVVIMLHGSGSHGGALGHLGTYLSLRGFDVYAFDYPGFGYSPGRRAISPPFDELQQVLLAYLDVIRQRHPHRPLFLVGESMGGTLAIYADIYGDLPVDGIVLCGAAFDYPPAANGLMRSAARIIGFFNKDLPLVPVEPSEFTRSEESIRRLSTDPLVVTTRIPVGHVNVLMREISEMRASLGQVRVPFYVQHGSEDRFAPLGGVEQLYREALSTEKRMTIYPGVKHGILHEPEWPQVAEDMIAWIEEQNRE